MTVERGKHGQWLVWALFAQEKLSGKTQMFSQSFGIHRDNSDVSISFSSAFRCVIQGGEWEKLMMTREPSKASSSLKEVN